MYSGKHGEPTNHENIFCSNYRCWLESVIIKLYENNKIYYYCYWWGIDVKFCRRCVCVSVCVCVWVVGGWGGYQNWTSASKVGRGSKFWSFYDNLIIECSPYATLCLSFFFIVDFEYGFVYCDGFTFTISYWWPYLQLKTDFTPWSIFLEINSEHCWLLGCRGVFRT